jgi:hypothetical protein
MAYEGGTAVTVHFRGLATKNYWAVFAGDKQISPTFYGHKYNALAEAKAWVSTWNWTMVVDDEQCN